jgi:peptidyl-prolyl cis-trans isomerase C
MRLCAALLFIAAMAWGVSANATDKKTETPAEVKKAEAPKAEAAKPAEVKAAPAEPNKPAKPAPKPIDPNETIVTVNAKVFKEKDFAPELNKRIEAQMKRMAGMGWPMNDETKAMMAEQVHEQVVDMVVDKTLIDEQLKAKKIDVNDAEINARFEEMVKDSGQKLEEIEAMLAKQGATIKDASYKAVTDADANKFYTDNPQYFQQPEQVQASHILIKTDEKADEATKAAAKAKAEELLKKVKAGGDFAALAKENSDCPSKERGGDLGLFGRGQMTPPFETAAFAMKVGDISDVVETQFGYHIIKLTDKKDASTISFAEAKSKITNHLKSQGMSQYATKLRQDLKANAKIEWAPAEKARRDQKAKEQQEKMAAQQQQRQMQQPQQATPVPPQPKPEESK